MWRHPNMGYQRLQRVDRTRIVFILPEDDGARLVVVCDRRAFTQELGIIGNAKITPGNFPEALSSTGMTSSSIVPGKIVDRMTTIWKATLCRSALPISSQTCRT
jgi:hypothetical protein